MRLVLLILFMHVCTSLEASHIIGGDIYYNYLGSNQYKFFITIYRDCASTGAAYDSPLPLAVFPSGSSTASQVILVPFPGSVILPIAFNNPCGTVPPGLCIERAIYTTTITLPPRIGGYTISYQRCCRGPEITNLVLPDDTGLTLAANVPGSETGAYANSSPRYTNYPPLLLCNNDQLVFDHSATDPDGDQLIYSLVTPFAGADSYKPAPNPPPAPPYLPVIWAGGYATTNPLGLGSNTTIHPSTGQLITSPKMIGIFVVGVRVQEFRNGKLIGQTVRDFLFKVLNCNITLAAILPTQEQLSTFKSYCQGLTVNFENKSYGGSVYQWDFGVSVTTSDVSNAYAPTFTYPVSGTYKATLVVNPGEPCTDTAQMVLTVNDPFTLSFKTKDSVCVKGNRFDFYGQSSNASVKNYQWDFGPNASTNTAATQNVSGVTFNTSGTIPVTISAATDYCKASYTDDIFIFPEPEVSIKLPEGYECKGLTVSFGNPSTGIISSFWDFGVPGSNADTSFRRSPTFTFPSGGTYPVRLIGSSTGLCVDTAMVLVKLNDLLEASFTHNDSLCLTDNRFWFKGSVNGVEGSLYKWDFGPRANPLSSNDLEVSAVVFDTAGVHDVKFTAWFDACSTEVNKQIFIYKVPSIDFTPILGPRCAPVSVQFKNLSQADSPMFFTWNLGDGESSTEVNPSHLFSFPGTYNISLRMVTTEGCVDTLNLLKPDLITLHPSPESKFTMDKSSMDICNAVVQFMDQSKGAVKYDYFFDDDTSPSTEQNPLHIFQSSGTLYPKQIVANAFGCKDSSFQQLTIEPFGIYFPNSFTPDGNQFNNVFNSVYGLEVKGWQLSIYDKWGELIFQSNNPQLGWDGSVNGNKAQDGTYIYTLRYISCDKPNDWQTITGHVNLLR